MSNREKSALEKIVPPLELCKLIPAGAFADSALVHEKMIPAFVCRTDGSDPTANRGNGIWVVSQRRPKRSEESRRSHGGEFIPAPTLAEIMDASPAGTLIKTVPDQHGKIACYRSEATAYYWADPHGIETDRSCPAIAALRLWLRVKGASC